MGAIRVSALVALATAATVHAQIPIRLDSFDEAPKPRAVKGPLSLDETTTEPASSQPASRALPSPFDSPPFPLSDFLGPTIGAPDTTPDWALQKLLNETPIGKLMKDGRNKTYGWFSPGFNWSTSKDSNSPAAYPLVPNKVVIDQIVLVTERALDTVQKDHFDWGYHVLGLYGTDYRYMIAKGLWSDQLLKRNELYGWDVPEFDLRFYFPDIADGTTLKIGRWISTPDIEACPTPANYLYTHSMTFSIDPYTYFGIMADVRLDKHWTVEIGLLGANDVAPWDESSQPNGHLMVRWVSDDNKDSIWGGINMIGAGKWKADHDDLQHLVATWTHKFDDKFHMLTEGYYMWQQDGNLGGTINYGPVKNFGGGGGPGWFETGHTDSWGL
ncbi:MAG TPA: outer membrane beta-barrel protein, partial [Phycisphaerae bacterium]|nr:outer membrane beta-barrel protein [Phycisphaerae bacterium]